MSGKSSLTKNTFRRLHIDRKMIGILVIFTVLGIFLVISMVIATNSLSGLRGYATFQVNWTEARKDATFHLVNYIKTTDGRHLARLDSALNLIKTAREIRYELLAEDTDKKAVRNLFLQTYTNPDDIDNMINTFVRFHSFSDFQVAIEEWIKSEDIIAKMEALKAEARQLIYEGVFSASQQQQFTTRTLEMDKELTESKHRLANALASGTHFLNSIILWFSISLGLILLITGGLLSFRFLKSIKDWKTKIELNEQQYRSLYEQNPNAVFSLSPDGRFIDANNIVEEVIGYSLNELKGMKFDRFVKESELENVHNHFKKALQGLPQNFETIGSLKNGELFYTEVTYLPILVNDQITGVYGIARDITFRKDAEQKIKDQLEEKTHLISEIHDRVKNNLALISSLIQLQREVTGSNKMEKHFESTISRIHSMAMVHERLYHNETLSSIRMDNYLNELIETVRKKYSPYSNKNQLIVDTRPVTLSIRQSVPTGLLLNELLVNAFKYGVKEGDGEIEIVLYQSEDEVVLKVADKGPGLPDDVSLESPKTLGMTLISVLIRQLNATYQFTNKNGASFTITFRTQGKISKIA